jgi:hypothetical protein
MKFTCWLLLLCQGAFAQTVGDVSARNDPYANISGNPFLLKDWSEGKVKFSNGRIMNNFKLKFDCVRNLLLMQFEGSTFAAESKITEFVLYTKTGKKADSMIFRKGFPAAEKTTESTYYQVLFEGRVTLVRLITKDIIEENVLVKTTTSTNRRLENVEKFYLLKDGAMIHLTADKEDWLKQLPDKAAQLSTYITEQRIRLRNMEDFVQVAKKLDEL